MLTWESPPRPARAWIVPVPVVAQRLESAALAISRRSRLDRMGVVLIVLGVALAAVAGFADTVGIGDDRGFHYRQAIGVGVGAALVVAGIVVGVRRSRQARDQTPDSAAPSRESDSSR